MHPLPIHSLAAQSVVETETVAISPLLIADRLITLAQQAERGGLVKAADRLVRLAMEVWDTPAGFQTA